MIRILTLLIGPLLLASCINEKLQLTSIDVGASTPAELQVVCIANKAIFVIVIDGSGKPLKLVCSDIGGKPIKEKLQPDPGLSLGTPIILGEVVKLKANGNPDPCIKWWTGGSQTFFCW